MSKKLERLFPSPHGSVDLSGLYLGLDLHLRGTRSKPFVYANFLSSLDGRIALEDDQGQAYLPKQLTTSDDFRLFLELHCQTDCLITHGGYLRALHEGRLGNILQVGGHELGPDLNEWRLKKGLKPQPDIVIASASLNFPMHESIAHHHQRCLIATGSEADPKKIQFWVNQGYEVISAGEGRMVEGKALITALSERGYRTPYLIAGPDMLDSMVREGQLRALFQTVSLQLMGGESFRTLTQGPILGSLGHMNMESLYYDQGLDANAVKQLFACFSCSE